LINQKFEFQRDFKWSRKVQKVSIVEFQIKF
jgi:hypothetical protein